MLRRSIALVLLACLAAPASGFQSLDVAIASAATGNLSDCRYVEVQAYLLATGQFATVDVLDVTTVTPSLAELQAYDAIVTWSNVDYADPVLLGDTLADYVDGGGGVVVAVFANSTGGSSRFLQGRWQLGYEIIPATLGTTNGQASLGSILVPGHPILQGVTTFDGGSSSFRPSTTTLTPGSSVVAEWDDGSTLVAVGTLGNRADLGFYPPPNICSGGFWNSATDGDLLLANALIFVAGGGSGLGTPYCLNTPNSTGGAAEISAFGSTSVATNLLNLEAAPVPDQPGLFFYGPNQVLLAFGNGFRCVGGTLGRLDVVNASANQLAFQVDNTQPPNASTVITPGSTWNFQAWYRDPAAGGAAFNLSNALEITFTP